MPLLHGFLLTFGFSWQEFPFLGLWCKRGGCCLFAGIFISFPDILSARKCWLVRLSVMPDFSFFWPDSGCMPVSYTHLDVYKRQVPSCGIEIAEIHRFAVNGDFPRLVSVESVRRSYVGRDCPVRIHRAPKMCIRDSLKSVTARVGLG